MVVAADDLRQGILARCADVDQDWAAFVLSAADYFDSEPMVEDDINNEALVEALWGMSRGEFAGALERARGSGMWPRSEAGRDPVI